MTPVALPHVEKFMDDPKPYGMYTRKHIAEDPRVALTPETLRVGLATGDYPPLVHDYMFGPTKVYSETTVEDWIARLLRQRAEAPARAAAKRAEQAARERAEVECAQREIAENMRRHKLIQDGFAATAAREAEELRLAQAETARVSTILYGSKS
ncbi:MAG: hypothetical protein EON54_14405 [Alcaligenaceae bacterium]|nr:MAG: hypothetical protein EON54_14405 [Alcaligenaceae bacterium]